MGKGLGRYNKRLNRTCHLRSDFVRSLRSVSHKTLLRLHALLAGRYKA